MEKLEKIQTIKRVPPPPGVPMYGVGKNSEICFLGRTNYESALQNRKFIFGIERKDRMRHMYVIGKNGTGKSSFLELIARQDIASGHGVCFMDPQGDTVESLLNFIPPSRVHDVVFIDFTDQDFLPSINPFFSVLSVLQHQYVEFLSIAFREYCGNVWTPEAEYVSRFIFLALMEYPNASLFSVLSLLTNLSYRNEVISYLKDPVVKSFWIHEFEEKKQMFEERVILPFQTRFGQLFFNSFARGIFSQSNPSVDFKKIIYEKKIIFIRLPKGVMPDDAVAFVGTLFLTFFRMGLLTLRIEEKKIDSFYLFIDEFQNIQQHVFEHIFSECNKSNVGITLAHRYLGQLSEGARASIFGNAGNIVIFRVSGEDAVKLRPEMIPVFDAKDMMNLGAREFYIKMTIRGEAYDPFSGESLKIFPIINGTREQIVSFSRKLWTLPKVEADSSFEKERERYSEKLDKIL